MSVKIEELDSLLLDWEAGTLDEEGVERVREILRGDLQARDHFVRMQMISAALKLDSDAGVGTATLIGQSERLVQANPTRVAPRRASGGMFRVRYLAAIAASLLLAVLLGRLAYLEYFGNGQQPVQIAKSDPDATPRATEEATSQGVALVTRLVDVQWQPDQTPLEVGDALLPGRLSIESGFAQIEFFCGATVVLEGPAELELESTTLARLRHGRLRAQVPPAARGFSLEVDDMTVVDLGTEFGLSVSPAGASVQVFEGEVELQRSSEQTRLVKAGQAVIREAGGSYETGDLQPDSFVDIGGLESRDLQQRSARYQKWKAASELLRRDPRLIAYYAFDQDGGWQRRLSSSVQPNNTELDGAIVGARPVAGRWALKQALEFKKPGDRVRVQIPGEYSSLTFACWVKIDSLDRLFNSLFLTDSYDKGEPHWQILDTGQMYFSVRPIARDEIGPADYKVLSPPFWQPSMSGKWLHLATTFDVDTLTVTHYLNGQLLSQAVVPAERIATTTRFGTATLGNWSGPTLPDAVFAIRNLNGSMDEFAIFAAALTEDEIQGMYEYGKP
jgi:hypothetical protein